MASADDINFSIRPNKAVERKLIFQKLTALAPFFGFEEYRYVGFGSLWFVDFVLAHKHLSIRDMISIENDDYLANRAKFNKPYACVNIKHGDSSEILKDPWLEERPLLVWLDYDTSLDGPVLMDISELCRRAPTHSVIIVTINAHKNSLPSKDGNGREFANDEERLRYYAPDLIPHSLSPKVMQASRYSAFLASLLFQHMHRQVRKAGRQTDKIVPIFNVAYRDNAPMITVGAVITDDRCADGVTKILDEIPIGNKTEEDQISIGVPPMTMKEKVTLDQLMPCDSAPTENDVKERCGFRMKKSQIENYHRFYRYYPVYGEISF